MFTQSQSLSLLQIGGRWNPSEGRVEAAFQGVLAGLVYNGRRPLETVEAKRIVGKVRRLQSIPFDYR